MKQTIIISILSIFSLGVFAQSAKKPEAPKQITMTFNEEQANKMLILFQIGFSFTDETDYNSKIRKSVKTFADSTATEFAGIMSKWYPKKEEVKKDSTENKKP